jgi:DNA invertase Pin-like site-specific DNA recombinase
MSEGHSTRRDLGIILTRVSDDKQSGASSQLTTTRHLAHVNAVEVVAEINDDGISSDDLDRAGLVEALDLLERYHRAAEPISWVLVDQSDRLSRADSLETSELLLKMRRLGVRKVATPSRIFKLYDALDRTLLQIEADHKNNPFLKDLARRVLNGMLDTARAGFWTGQKCPIGYKVIYTPGEHQKKNRRSGRLVLDPETAPIVRELFERYLECGSTREVTRLLQLRTGRRWSQQGVQRILEKEIYTGTRVFGGRTKSEKVKLVDGEAVIVGQEDDEQPADSKENGTQPPEGHDVVKIACCPAIIDQELFLAVQAKLREGKYRTRKKNSVPMALTGLCRCGACGSRMGVNRHYQRCTRKDEVDGKGCPRSNYHRSDEILRRVLTRLADDLLAGDTVARLAELAGTAQDEARQQHEASLNTARKALDACEARLATARRRLAEAPDDLVEEVQRLIRELRDSLAGGVSCSLCWQRRDGTQTERRSPGTGDGDPGLSDREGCQEQGHGGSDRGGITLMAQSPVDYHGKDWRL